MNDLVRLSELIKQRNATEQDITALILRPAAIGHLGEFIASKIFRISLAESASQKGFDGHFLDSSLAERSVNIKWYGKQEGILDITPDSLPDFYLVFAGPKSSASSSVGSVRPWLITSVYLFDARQLLEQLQNAGVKLGIATSVRQHLWESAEIYPIQRNTQIMLSSEQRELLTLFG